MDDKVKKTPKPKAKSAATKKVAAKTTKTKSATVKKAAAKESGAVKILMATNLGNIELELYPDKAPITVENFLNYVKEKYFDGLIFHRVIKNFMIQGGGYDEKFEERKSKNAPIKNEADNGLKNERGTIAMARTSDPHSATAQFFINHKNNDFLDYKSPTVSGWGYAVFGRVTGGMDVVDSIAGAATGNHLYFQDVPKNIILIKSIELV